MAFNSVNLSADISKARDLSPVKADVSQSAVIHSVRITLKGQMNLHRHPQTVLHRERWREREISLWIGTDIKKERLYVKQITECGVGWGGG